MSGYSNELGQKCQLASECMNNSITGPCVKNILIDMLLEITGCKRHIYHDSNHSIKV